WSSFSRGSFRRYLPGDVKRFQGSPLVGAPLLPGRAVPLGLLCLPVALGSAPEDPADDREHDEAEHDAGGGDDGHGGLLRDRRDHDATFAACRRSALSMTAPTTSSGSGPFSAAAA